MPRQLSNGDDTGQTLGQNTADPISFYGVPPVSQRASSNQATSAVAVSASFGATQLAALQEVMNALIAIGLIKGSA